MAHIIVERTFEPPLTDSGLSDLQARMGRCLKAIDVRWMRSFWSADRRRMVCHYEADDAEAVREVQRMAQAPFDRVWNADVLLP
jgi:hypothetical protein